MVKLFLASKTKPHSKSKVIYYWISTGLSILIDEEKTQQKSQIKVDDRLCCVTTIFDQFKPVSCVLFQIFPLSTVSSTSVFPFPVYKILKSSDSSPRHFYNICSIFSRFGYDDRSTFGAVSALLSHIFFLRLNSTFFHIGTLCS